jgi:hypothetical protein
MNCQKGSSNTETLKSPKEIRLKLGENQVYKQISLRIVQDVENNNDASEDYSM